MRHLKKRITWNHIMRTVSTPLHNDSSTCWFSQVILGGGRMYMTPKGTPDPEYPTSNSRKGDRKDRKNLIDVWLKAKPVGLLDIISEVLQVLFALPNRFM